MNLNKKLNQWLEAELIDTVTLTRIKDFEKANSKPLMLYATSGIGALSLCLGLISIIAANWQEISPNVKLGLDLLLGLSLCTYLAFNHKSLPKWAKETFIALISGWTLASIGLIGQIYQLGGDGKSAITLWTVLILPLLFQGRSTFSGILLLGSVWASYSLWMFHLQEVHMITVIPTLFLGIFALRLYQPIYQKRPEILSVFSFVALMSLLSASTFSPFIFYKRDILGKDLKYIYEALVLCLPSVYVLWRLIKHKAKSIQVALFASIFCAFIPLLIPHQGDLDHLAILFFLGYWSIIAKAALDLDQVLVFRLATFLLALRLVIVYFELVGTLLDTGFLFLSGGFLILFSARFWYRKQQEILDKRQGTLSDPELISTAPQSSPQSDLSPESSPSKLDVQPDDQDQADTSQETIQGLPKSEKNTSPSNQDNTHVKSTNQELEGSDS